MSFRAPQIPQITNSPQKLGHEMTAEQLQTVTQMKREMVANSPETLSNFRAVVFSGSEVRHESLRRLQKNQAEVVLAVVLAGLESSPIYQSVCPNLAKAPLFCVAQSVAQLAEGFALSRDADSTT
jgi:hypothetical protein